jgi:hypothetical protein
MAVILSISAREIGSKILAIWFPTATFVALALDHVIANMFFIPIRIWTGAPFGVGYYIWLIPTTLGSMVGGDLFVGAIYWYLYLTEVSFDLGGLASAMAAGGRMRRDRRFDGQRINGDGSVIMGVPNHQEGGGVEDSQPWERGEDEW